MLLHNIDTTLGSCHGFILDLNSRVNPNLKPIFNCKLADLTTSVCVKLKLCVQVASYNCNLYIGLYSKLCIIICVHKAGYLFRIYYSSELLRTKRVLKGHKSHQAIYKTAPTSPCRGGVVSMTTGLLMATDSRPAPLRAATVT